MKSIETSGASLYPITPASSNTVRIESPNPSARIPQQRRASSPYALTTDDQSSGGGNSIEPQQRRAKTAPSVGLWVRGDTFWNSEPWPGAPIGWVRTSAGTPGVWDAFGRIE